MSDRKRVGRRSRINAATHRVATAVSWLEFAAAVIEHDAVTRDDLRFSPREVHDQLRELAGRILLADVPGGLTDEDVARLLGGDS